MNFDSYGVQLLPSTSAANAANGLSGPSPQCAMSNAKRVKLQKSINETKDMVIAFVLNLKHHTLCIYTNGNLVVLE